VGGGCLRGRRGGVRAALALAALSLTAARGDNGWQALICVMQFQAVMMDLKANQRVCGPYALMCLDNGALQPVAGVANGEYLKRRGRCSGVRLNMADSFSYEQLIASGEGRLFGADSGRLPLPPMLMFDRITHIDSDGGAHGLGKIRAELDVKPDLWFFACHFQGDPVMPGCLGLDAMWQPRFHLTCCARRASLGAGEVILVKWARRETLTYEIDIKRVIKRKLVMAIGDARLLADGKEIYVANDLRVGLFKREEDGKDAA
jgi:3-hydroxyacyl-[acyl-carrier protein] dehydratase/trans-2-decenoyl-[acyl-carrier protein] isomerase